MVTKKLRMTCPCCGMLVEIDRFYKEHKFPRLVEVSYLGGRFDYKEIYDEDIISEIKFVIAEKLKQIL